MKRLVLFCLWLITTSIAFSQKQKPATNRFAGLDTAFARVLKDWKAAGFAVAVVEKDKVVYAQGFGYKEFEKKQPATANTQFAIGSCTKAFTSSLVGLLEADKKVELDKPVRTYLPQLQFATNEMNSYVTLRDMMCHRTGVSRYDYSWYFFPSNSVDSLMQRVQVMEPSEPLRQKWQYNNYMFMLQGAVVSKLTGKSWEENLHQNIFSPLQMTNTTSNLADWMKAPDLSVGYGLKKDSIIDKLDYYNIRAMAPAGSINSSVNDMAKWLTLWINGGKYGGKQVLPASYVSEAMSSQMVMAGALPGKDRPDLYMSNYGFGWMLTSYRSHYRVEHGGNIDGFSASTCFFPSDSVGIVVLCNQNGSQVPAVVRNIISDRILGLPYRDWETSLYQPIAEGKKKAAEAAKTVTSNQVRGTKTSHPLADFAGLYTHNGQEQIEIIYQHDSLYAQLPAMKWWLQHYHYDVFQPFDIDKKTGIDTSDAGPLRFNFVTNDAGKITEFALPLEPGTKPITFTRTAKAGVISQDSLQKYTGDYTLNGVELKVYVKEQNSLYLFVPGQPEYELVFEEKNKFGLKIIKGYEVQFNLNDKGEVTELMLIQPNGTFKATRKVKL